MIEQLANAAQLLIDHPLALASAMVGAVLAWALSHSAKAVASGQDSDYANAFLALYWLIAALLFAVLTAIVTK